MTPLAERPAEVDDRTVPGHWEGDLILGAGSRSAVATLVERTTRFVVLGHLPIERTADAVRDSLVTALGQMPASLRRTLTWDQGAEMSEHRGFAMATDMAVYFCEPASPLAARHEREHQRTATAVPPEALRPQHARPGRPDDDRRRAQRPAPQGTRLGHPGRTNDCFTRHDMTAGRCDDRWNPRRPAVGDVRDRQLVGSRCGELPLHQVRAQVRSRAGDRGSWPLGPADAVQPGGPHEPFDGAAGDPVPVALQLSVDLADPVDAVVLGMDTLDQCARHRVAACSL